jgi:RHS repeat-associated protein
LSAALAGKDPVRSELVASADLLTPKRLTEVLRGSEHLDRGEVLTSRVSRASADDGSSFGYDANGNMTSVSGPLGSWTLAYDDQNRLTSMAYPSGTDTFTYNALGQRMRANLNGSVLRYIYSGDRVVEQTDDEGNMLTRYGLATGSYYDPLLGLEFADGDQRYPLSDLIGTARRLVDESGTATDAYSLDAFGRYMDGWTNQTPSPYRFGGAWGYTTDTPGSGLLQLGARFYWPEVGRFVSQDPIGDGVNWYAYADDNPLTGIDPEGLVRADDVYDAVGNFLGGATDTLSFGLAAPLRRAFGVREEPDPCSGWYTGGKLAIIAAGTAATLGTFGELEAGAEMASGAVEAETEVAAAARTWPSTVEEMNDFLGVEGESVADGEYLGRGKVVWKLGENKITYDQHPYDIGGAPQHTGPHWHLDTKVAGISHQRYLPGTPIPGY